MIRTQHWWSSWSFFDYFKLDICSSLMEFNGHTSLISVLWAIVFFLVCWPHSFYLDQIGRERERERVDSKSNNVCKAVFWKNLNFGRVECTERLIVEDQGTKSWSGNERSHWIRQRQYPETISQSGLSETCPSKDVGKYSVDKNLFQFIQFRGNEIEFDRCAIWEGKRWPEISTLEPKDIHSRSMATTEILLWEKIKYIMNANFDDQIHTRLLFENGTQFSFLHFFACIVNLGFKVRLSQ